MMTKRERVLSAIALQPADRPPVGFWFHFQDDQGCGDACVKAHLDYYNRIDVDMVKIMCDSYFDYPNPVAKNAKSPADWYAMKPLGPDSAFIREQADRAAKIKAGLKDDMVIIYNVFAPFSLLRFGAGDGLVMQHLREDPEAILYALDVVAQDQMTLCEQLMHEAKIDGVYYCVQAGEKNRFTVEEYRRLITPSDMKVLAHANALGAVSVLHCCGWAGIPNNMEVWQDYPASAVNWACYVEDMDLAAGQKFFGGKCVLGGFDNRPGGVLYSGTKEEVQAEARALIAKAGKAGIMLGADCTLPANVDVSRFGWVAEAMQELA